MNRRDLLVGAAGVALSAVVPPVVLARADSKRITGTAGEAFFCIDDTANLDSTYYSYISALETKLGRKFAGIRLNYGPDNSPVVSPDLTKSYSLGRHWIYQNGKPNPIAPDTDTSGTYWRSIANGRYDSVYLNYWQAITATGLFTTDKPLHYSPQHEQTSLSEPPAGKGAGTASDWIACFRHIHDLCVAHGYHVSVGGCIALCFIPNLNQIQHDPVYGSGTPSSATAPYQVSKMDPGPAYYDLCGMDCYWKSTMGSLTASQSFGPLVKWAQTVGRPWMVGEFGIDKSHPVSTFLKGLTTIIEGCGVGPGGGQCYAICGTSRVASGGDYRYDATSSTLSAWKAFGAQSLFGAAF